MVNNNLMQIYDSGTIVAIAATDVQATSRIKGYIVKVEIIASASTTFKLFVDASDDNTSAIVDQYILGGSSSTVTVAAAEVYYPVATQVLAAGTATDPDQYSLHFVDDAIEISASSLTATDTYRVKIYYIPYENISG